MLTYTAALTIVKAILESESTLDRFILFFGIFFAIVCIINVCFYKIEANNFCYFLNQLVQLELCILDTYKRPGSQFQLTTSKKTTKAVRMCLKMFTFALRAHTIVHALSSSLDPTVPWNLLPSVVINPGSSNFNCHSFFPLGLIKRIIVLIYIYILIKIYADLTVIYNMVSLFVPTYCLSACLKFLQRQLSVHRTSQNIHKYLKTYRQIQLIVIFYNCIHRKLFLPVLIIAVIMCLSGSAFVLISISTKIHFTALFIFLNLFIVGVACVFVNFYFSAMLYQISNINLALFKKCFIRVQTLEFSNEFKERKFARKYIRSLCPLKIRFLHSNYFDRLTPLVLFKFSMRLALQLSLIKK